MIFFKVPLYFFNYKVLFAYFYLVSKIPIKYK